jgi:hypothetical protein
MMKPWINLFGRSGLAALGLLLAAVSASARDDEDDDVERDADQVCSATTRALHAACRHEARDDAALARARCLHRSDAAERAACLREARAQRQEAEAACGAQRDWRQASCRVLGEGRYDPDFAPERFETDFTRLARPNPYFPLTPGLRWEYRGGNERNLVEVTHETKLIEGVNCIVLRDLVYQDGALKEATDDWFAAARDGTAWYCGEEVKDYESFEGDRPMRPELVSIDGSFKHGRDGDKAGVVMPGAPRAGQVYREEFSLANAEDVSLVLATDYGWGGGGSELDRGVPRALAQRLCQRDCVVTMNYSLLEPGQHALKYYARGIGFFLEVQPAGGAPLQLVSCNFDARCADLPAPSNLARPALKPGNRAQRR